ncbi:asparaginase [Hyunsoonleella sp. 2307UL5-6]|uniref:asparaginase n=1 Tax=Hyunsoonleella sp. 2307UL5-6 TaxID=3384768 RepID=UPI0039BD38DA
MSNVKPNILLIYTGGTIGMVKDIKTGALHAFNFKNLLKQIPELKLIDCKIEAMSFENPIDSSNMKPEYWIQIANSIELHYNEFDGFVVLHGSDTMSYTASALSFMLENLSKPVIFTGAQLPIGDLRTDAKENLITSIQIASLQNEKREPIIKEVGLYFEYKLYRANRTTKINAENFQAFNSLNYPYLAESGVHLKINHQYLLKTKPNQPLIVHKKLDNNIALLKLFPGFAASHLNSVLKTPNLKAVLLETYGSGNCTTEKWFLNALKKAIANGIQIINVTQCVGGGVNMGQYETSSHLKSIGVISGKDMTTESAITKLMYLLGKSYLEKSLKHEFEIALRGEIT